MIDSIKYKSFILKLKSSKHQIYKNIDLDRLAVFVMDFLESKGIPLYYEYIAIALFKMFPEKFSLITFKEYPDMNRIADVLQLNLNPTHRNWAVGNIKHQFRLTPLGKEIVSQVKMMMANPEKQKDLRKNINPRMKSIEGDIEEILNSSLYKKWKDGKEQINEFEILPFLGVMSFTKIDVIQKRILRLKDICKNAKNLEAKMFIDSIAKIINLK